MTTSTHGPRWRIEFVAADADIAEREFKARLDAEAKKDPTIREHGAAVRIWIAKQPRDKDKDVLVHFSGYINGIGANVKAEVGLVDRKHRVIVK